MVNLMNMTKEESAELIDVLEKEQNRLRSGIDQSPRSPESPSSDRQQEMVKRLLWKAKLGNSTPSILDSSEWRKQRMSGYC